MNAFTLFDVLEQTNESNQVKQKQCEHIERINNICTECGMEVEPLKPNDKEWTFYGASDTKHSSDPTRCYIRRQTDKSIHSDISHLEISEHIKDIANDIYKQACKEQIHRGAFRKAIIFASVYHAYKLDGNPQNCNSLIKLFNIKKKTGLRGIKYLNEHLPKTSPIRTIYIGAEHLIREFMKKLEARDDQIQKVTTLYQQVKGQSEIINRSRPQSIAAGVIYYYILLQKKNIDIKDFLRQVELSELTIRKIALECANIFGNPEILD